MIFTYEDKIRANDLACDYKEELIGITIDRIKDDDELMQDITQYCRGEQMEYEGALKLQQLIDLKVEELAKKAVDSIRIYASFDIEVSEVNL